MPFLRILRDKRGIEHLFVYEPGRDGRLRILYWFRSSSAAKASGRTPLDEATRLDIEQRFPDITFDWQTLWQTVTMGTLPEVVRPVATPAEAETPAGAADGETARGDRSAPAKRRRNGRPDQAVRGGEPPAADQDRVRARRSARARRRPRSARRAAMETSPASEASE